MRIMEPSVDVVSLFECKEISQSLLLINFHLLFHSVGLLSLRMIIKLLTFILISSMPRLSLQIEETPP